MLNSCSDSFSPFRLSPVAQAKCPGGSSAAVALHRRTAHASSQKQSCSSHSIKLPPQSSPLPDPPQNVGLQQLADLHEGLIGQWCAVIYDGDVYPGIIQAIDMFSGALVKTMSKIGHNRFFWPLRDDIIWYQPMTIIGLISESVPVTKRHKEIIAPVWEKIIRFHCVVSSVLYSYSLQKMSC